MKIFKLISFLIFVLFVISCGTSTKAYLKNNVYSQKQSLPKDGLVHTAFLIGDAGGLDNYSAEKNIVFDAVEKKIIPGAKNQSIIFLGDNIYSDGLSKKETADRSREEKILNAHLALGKKNSGKTYFIPGNHDWNNSKKGGRKSILRQYDYIKDFDTSGDIKFYPKKACGDPEVVEVTKDLVYFFIDSQWWLQDWENEKKMNKGCEIKTRRAFANKIQDLFIEYKNDQIVVFLHHPFLSNGNHGGKYSFKEHFFPLTAIDKNAFIPLPVLGSAVPFLRNLGISRQDIPNALYQDLHGIFLDAIALAKSERVIFSAGHEHSLQHFHPEILLSKNNINYLVSGSGYKTNYTRKGGAAEFAYSARGFQVLNFYDDAGVWLDIYSVNETSGRSTLEYRRKIAESLPKNEPAPVDFKISSLVGDTSTIPNMDLKSGTFKNFLLGEQYRDLWTESVDAKLIDLEKIHGGLVPVKLGGGQSSNSLRLEAKNEKQYILRSVNKDYYKLFPQEYKKLVWIKVYADQNASAIPYGALMIPRLSDALGIYHTDPQLFYLKKQKGLLQYNNLINEGLYLFEKRPDGKVWKDDKSFGFSEKIIGFNDLIEKLETKTTHFVDQKWTLKSRLFDMWIHDWDRHDDQWRWAAFESEDKTIYRPIPRDRDWAFFKYQGLVYKIFSTFYMRKFRTFESKIKDIIGLTTSASHFDRYFLNELTWSDWEAAVDSMQRNMTEEVILQAIHDLPKEAIPIVKEELQTKLTQRLKDMKKYARAYYKILYKEVDVVGTNEEDIFEVEYFEDGKILIQLFRDSKKHGKVLRYQRLFDPSITKEIRLFGLAETDNFELKGEASKKIKLRIIGGEGKDKISNDLKSKRNKFIIVHDNPEGIKDKGLKGLKTKINYNLDNNEYNRNQFKYNSITPKLKFGSTFDDGFWIGGGFIKTNHGYQKSPFKSQHNFDVSIAPSSRRAINLNYRGAFTDILTSRISFNPQVFVHNPNYLNFFGFQNELPAESIQRRFNWVRISSFGVYPLFGKSWNNNRITLRFGPTYESHELNIQEGRVLEVYDAFSEEDFERDHFIGFRGEVNMAVIDQPVDPGFGFRFNLSSTYNYNLISPARTLNFNSSLTFYVPLLTTPKVTLANRIGYNHVFGDPEIYQLPALGINTFLRPYRNDRFRGDGVFYHQLDLRANLFSWNNNFFPMTVGVTGGFDYGKAFLQNFADSDLLKGFSTGLSLNILDAFVVHPFMTFSEEGRFFNLATGFSF